MKTDWLKLAEKSILAIGAAIALFSLEMELLRTEKISQLAIGSCLMPIFYAVCIFLVLIVIGIIKEKIEYKRQEE